MPISILALTLCAFAIGTTEFVTVGLVTTISQDLNISISSAGLLISMYAFGVAIGAPILTAITSKINKKYVLASALLIFALGHVLASFAPNFSVLVFARILTGLTHGLFFSIGSFIAVSLVPKEKEARAIALMFTGLTLALVSGVPLGTFIGQEFGWRNTFALISVLGFIAFIGILLLIPNNIKTSSSSNFFSQFKILANPNLLLAYLITIIGFGGSFIVFTYLVPILENITKFDSSNIASILLLFGIATVIGNLIGGKLSDKYGAPIVLFFMLLCLSITLLNFYFFASNQIIAIVLIFFWGIFAFGSSPVLQVNVLKIAKKHTPNFIEVASGFNISAFNIGISIASFTGGIIVSEKSLLFTSLISALVVFCSIFIVYFSSKIDKT